MDKNGNYHWAFFGYGKAKKDLNFKNPTLEEQLQIYGTLERFGGNAIDPVEFMKKHLIAPRPLPNKIKTVTWNKTAPGSKDGRPYHWDAVTTRLEFPKNGRAIIRIRASASGDNKGKDAANLRLLFNGVDLRELKNDLGITATEFRGSDLKGFSKELYLFVDLKSFESSVPEAKRGFWEKLWEGKNTVDIEFIADEKPTLESIDLYEWDGRTVDLDFFERPDPNGFSRAGIPWKAFVSLGKEVVRASSKVRSASAQMREDTDDDSAKFIVNNVIQKHLDYPDAPRYMNWRASGNQDKGALREVVIEKFKKGRPWNAMEIWVDNQPFLENVTFEF